MQTDRRQIRMMVPPHQKYIKTVQDTAVNFASLCGVDASGFSRIKLAIEEAYGIVLRYSFGEEDQEGELEWRFILDPPRIRAEIIDVGLPFDLSMVPDFHPETLTLANLETAESAISYILLKHCTDTCRIVNTGRQGIRFELAWYLPSENIAETESSTDDCPHDSAEPAPIEGIQILSADFALQIARLIYRGYGYSYVYEDVYYPDRVAAHFTSGSLKSWGAVTVEGQLVGHLALMRDAALPNAVEWGLVVVAPRWRGMRLMERMLQAATDDAEQSGAPVFFTHAVTNHPYTQKTCERFQFYPTALLLCYAPASLRFKGINPVLKQRESTFAAVRMMHPMPPAELYLPAPYTDILKRLINALDIPQANQPVLRHVDEDLDLTGRLTKYKAAVVSSINIATITVDQTGEDAKALLLREWQRLCNERVDVIYLTLDLSDPGAFKIVQTFETAGFFLAGLTPSIMGPDYGLTLQYMNNLKVSFEAIQVFSESWQALKADVFQDKERVEHGV